MDTSKSFDIFGMTPDQALAARNSYKYPAVGLSGTVAALSVIKFPSTTALDEYHCGLLHASDDDTLVFGYLSVVFWGHYSGRNRSQLEKRALARVRMAYEGYDRGINTHLMGVKDLGIGEAAVLLRETMKHLSDSRISDGLRTAMKLPQCGPAFASKICAFMAPDKCGVIDSVLAQKFPTLGFALASRNLLRWNTNSFAQYEQYCPSLTNFADDLNSLGEKYHWSDTDGSKHPWRAVDVERSLYASVPDSVSIERLD